MEMFTWRLLFLDCIAANLESASLERQFDGPRNGEALAQRFPVDSPSFSVRPFQVNRFLLITAASISYFVYSCVTADRS